MAYELLLTETFQNQLLALPHRELSNVMAKVGLLRTSPQVDGKAKKRLVNYKRAVYRIRAGDYRILYAFGTNWVKLIGVDHRKDVYHRGELIDYDDPLFVAAEMRPIEEDLVPENVPFLARPRQTNSGPDEIRSDKEICPRHRPEPTPLGRDITIDLLRRLRISNDFFDALTACHTDDDLIQASVPDEVRNSVFDVVSARDYDIVDQQPVKSVPDVEDLSRFYNGTLLDFHLLLDPTQRSIIKKIAKGGGPYRIGGAPGTGKSTVLMYAAEELRSRWLKHESDEPRILFTTYTNALTRTSGSLLAQLLQDRSSSIEVTTVNRVARGIVNRVDGPPKIDNNHDGFLRYEVRRAIQAVRQQCNADERRELDLLVEQRINLDYLIAEIENLIVARDIRELEEYRQESRAGRQMQLGRNQRALVWRIHESFSARLKERGMTTWARLNRRAWHLVEQNQVYRSFDAVFVDEAQDLPPNALRFLAGLCRPTDGSVERLYLAADSNQTIYGLGSGVAWSDIHPGLAQPSQVRQFNVNYRSTQQILRGAAAYLKGAELEEEQPKITHMRKGPKPNARFLTTADVEIGTIEEFFRHATKELQRGFEMCAVLVPTHDAGRRVESKLTFAGLPARFMPSEEVDIRFQGIKILTLHSAKGLEFPIVAVALCTQPVTSAHDAPEVQYQRRRLNHMAMTRATRSLLVTLPTTDEDRFSGISAPLWDVEYDSVPF